MSAATRTVCPLQVAFFSTTPASARRSRMTPTACGSTWRGLISNGASLNNASGRTEFFPLPTFVTQLDDRFLIDHERLHEPMGRASTRHIDAHREDTSG